MWRCLDQRQSHCLTDCSRRFASLVSGHILSRTCADEWGKKPKGWRCIDLAGVSPGLLRLLPFNLGGRTRQNAIALLKLAAVAGFVASNSPGAFWNG